MQVRRDAAGEKGFLAGCTDPSNVLHDVPSGSAVSASHTAKTASNSSSPGAALAPAETSALASANRPAAYDITDRPAAGSRGVQALPTPAALPANLVAPADALKCAAGSAPLHSPAGGLLLPGCLPGKAGIGSARSCGCGASLSANRIASHCGIGPTGPAGQVIRSAC